MIRLLLGTFLAVFFTSLPPGCVDAKEKIVPRTIIALYDDRGEGPSSSLIHLLAEMPLNHLGLDVEYHDIHSGALPSIADRDDVRGVITWFFSNTKIDNPEAYIKWAEDAINAGKKYIVIGPSGVPQDSSVSLAAANKFLSMIGYNITSSWIENPFDVTYLYNTQDMFYERQPFKWMRPPYQITKAVGKETQVHLATHRDKNPADDCDLIITSPTGGYIASEYAFRENIRSGDGVKQWFIDPFEFFRLVYATDDLPKPDTTTIAGRRIYYSHIDGDGWNNMTRIEEYKEHPTLSARVIMNRVIKSYPDMPVTLTLIAADIDPKWAAVTHSREIAKEFFTLPQVEAGSHTYSHPFYWQFFEHYTPEKEIKYLRLYNNPTWKPDKAVQPTKKAPPSMPAGYTTPRAYAYEKFDIHKEIEGALQKIAELLPKDKKMKVVTWPGDCLPWEAVLRMTREAGVQNINGGDTRFDPEYPTPASVAPVGRPVGKERQIYSSMSNENTYTNLWSENFYAQSHLKKTIYNTGTPYRLKPINVYYHIYSGERDASLNAVLSNIEYARKQDIVPVTTSDYTRIAEGFYSTQITVLSPDMWRIEQRGALQTIRFDHHSLDAVDFQRSKGVIGERYAQGSLYVYLDAAVPQPVIALKKNDTYFSAPMENTSYLVESRWLISNVNRKKDTLHFTAQGFGKGEMIWQMPAPGHYIIHIENEEIEADVAKDRLLRVALKNNAMNPVHISIRSL